MPPASSYLRHISPSPMGILALAILDYHAMTTSRSDTPCYLAECNELMCSMCCIPPLVILATGQTIAFPSVFSEALRYLIIVYYPRLSHELILRARLHSVHRLVHMYLYIYSSHLYTAWSKKITLRDENEQWGDGQ
jgi:hypothetical protein